MVSNYHPNPKLKLFCAAPRSDLLLLLFAFIFTSTQPAAGQLEARPLTHNGYLRPYLIFRPAHLPPHPAVVFMLGGIRSTAKSEAENFGWMEQAERNSFLAVFRSRSRRGPTNRRTGTTTT
jgi:poly(3-hydroxybutyrate) depolymerase